MRETVMACKMSKTITVTVYCLEKRGGQSRVLGMWGGWNESPWGVQWHSWETCFLKKIWFSGLHSEFYHLH